MNIAEIENSALNGELTLPPSKSAAHRAIICSFLAGGGTVAVSYTHLETEVRAGEVNPNNHEGDVALDPETVKEATRGCLLYTSFVSA